MQIFQRFFHKRQSVLPNDTQRLAAWRAGEGTQKLGRAINFQIPTKLSASIHPD